jgi:hypothetical protein
MEKEEMVPKKAAIESVRKVGYLFGLLHYWYTRTLWDELGKEKGTELVKKALGDFARDRTMKMRRKAEKLGYEGAVEKGGPMPMPSEVNDLPVPPVTLLSAELGRYHCPFGAAWLDKEAEDPEYCEIGFLYCKTNDPIKVNSYNPEYEQVGDKIEGLWDTHICFGDESCRRKRKHIPTGKISDPLASHF